jgi:hypothetical protein
MNFTILFTENDNSKRWVANHKKNKHQYDDEILKINKRRTTAKQNIVEYYTDGLTLYRVDLMDNDYEHTKFMLAFYAHDTTKFPGGDDIFYVKPESYECIRELIECCVEKVLCS